MRTFPVLFIALLLLQACTRNNVPEPELSQYVITNNLDKPVTVRIGDTTNELGELYMEIQPHKFVYAYFPNGEGSVLIPDVMQEQDFAYYWATDDYSMSDWYSRKPGQWHERKYTTRSYKNGIVKSIDINPVPVREDMKYCLNGIDKYTLWNFIDAYDNNGNSVWASLSPDKKFQRVILRFNRMGSIMGASSHESGFEYELVDSTAAFVLKNTPNYISPIVKAGNYLRMTNDLRGMAPLYTTSTDTLYLSLGGGAPYYLLVKQR